MVGSKDPAVFVWGALRRCPAGPQLKYRKQPHAKIERTTRALELKRQIEKKMPKVEFVKKAS
jgi:hypothetical protein